MQTPKNRNRRHLRGLAAALAGLLTLGAAPSQAQQPQSEAEGLTKEQIAELLGKVKWSGDFRGRFEHFGFDEDGVKDRSRGRYRLRLGGKAKVNERVSAGFRLASGGESRSTNESFGGNDDFAPDSFNIDRAFAELKWGGLKLTAGRQSNPFRWKNGKDYLLWDGDINPEGVALQYKVKPGGNLELFVNSGYFIIDEESSAADPHIFGLQGGFAAELSGGVSLGARASWYAFRSLDGDFFSRNARNGNEALVTQGATGLMRSLDAYEVGAWLRAGNESWPLLVFLHYASNGDAGQPMVTDAMGTRSLEAQDTGYGIGVELGSKKHFARLGFGYYSLEADFWPALFVDSDLGDGKTNREGFTAYISRQIWKNTDFNLTWFSSDVAEKAFPDDKAKRTRLQADLVIEF